jgi:hypothetical protein
VTLAPSYYTADGSLTLMAGTNKQATCRWSSFQSSYLGLSSSNNMIADGVGTTHSKDLQLSVQGTFNYYVYCRALG